jgi:type IV pilus assembly protein PilE
VKRGYIVDATNALSSLRAQMEQYYQDNRTYANAAPFTSPCVASKAGKFNITCTSDATTYTITATGTESVAKFTYTIDQTGAQKTTASEWSTSETCWLTKKGATC